ncbi:MAG TPA: gephyrin-like molybdotransferase Glp [Kineosporiaceae bacterium]|nr:gephyrin-like molybdotransferase Glp [Kineosporiaceae bacterium]
MKPVEEHVADCLSAVRPLDPVELTLLDALDCILAQDVASPVDLPRFDNSSMDGYAVRIPDVATATAGRPVTLPVSADLAAGVDHVAALATATAARIMTGAPVPDGTDAVVPVEWTDHGETTVAVLRPPSPGQYVRRAGEDVRAGERVLTNGTRLSPRHIALLAAVGRDRVLVHPRPRVVVLSTGSELVAPGDPLAFGRIHDANGYGLTAAALELGALARHGGIVPDREDAVLAALEAALVDADVLITSGGVSAGVYDTVKAVLRRLGTVSFEKVAMQPGMPQGFGTLGAHETPIFTLPGNPVSSMVSFEMFVRPVLRKLAGETSLHRYVVPAVSARPWSSPRGKRQFVRAVLERRSDGVSVVSPVGGQGSHLVADLAEATCLAVVPEQVTEVTIGMTLNCMLLDRARR